MNIVISDKKAKRLSCVVTLWCFWNTQCYLILTSHTECEKTVEAWNSIEEWIWPWHCLKIKCMEGRPRMFLKIWIFQENDQEKAILWHLLNFKMTSGYHLYLRPPMEKKKISLFRMCFIPGLQSAVYILNWWDIYAINSQ